MMVPENCPQISPLSRHPWYSWAHLCVTLCRDSSWHLFEDLPVCVHDGSYPLGMAGLGLWLLFALHYVSFVLLGPMMLQIHDSHEKYELKFKRTNLQALLQLWNLHLSHFTGSC